MEKVEVSSSDSIQADALYEIELNGRLDKRWLEKAENELGENDRIRSLKLQELNQRCFQDDKIPDARLDDAFLLRFLRAKKFDIDSSFRMLKKYFKMKNESSELFRVSSSSDLHNLLKMQIQQVLPDREQSGSIVYIFRVRNCDPYKVSVEHLFRSNVMALENSIRDPCTQIAGLVVLVDFSGLRLAHTKYLSPHLAKRTVEVIQDVFPMRFKAFHILHEPFYFDAILAILKPFLKEKIRNRIHTHGSDLKSLHRHIPKEILPSEYGGMQGNFDNTKWRQQIIHNHNYFLRLESYGTANTNRKISATEINGS